ncbi:MAG: radical SAM protein [Planctomycetota bacterium]
MRLLSYISEIGGLRRGSSHRPRTLTHTVSFLCNARCVMCDSWRLPKQDELTTDEIDRIYAQLPELDAVRLTGGEPFVRKDMADITRIAVDRLRPRFVHVTTNGFLTDRIVDYAEDRDTATPLHVLVSVDGVEEKHDEVRGVPRSYERAMETVRQLVARREALNLRIAVNQTVIDAEGARHYRPLRDELAELGVKNHLIVAYKESATYSLERNLERAVDGANSYETYGAFSKAEIELLLDQAEADLVELDRPERLAKSYYIAGLRRRLLGQDGPAGPSCVALHAHLRLFPNGDVPTCQHNTKIVGNLREQSFAEVWESARAQEQRRWVKKCEGCWTECEVLPSAVYTGELAMHALRRPTESLVAARGGTAPQSEDSARNRAVTGATA